VVLPRKPFKKTWIFSELIKDAINYGYEFNLICGYNFDRGPEVFNNM